MRKTKNLIIYPIPSELSGKCNIIISGGAACIGNILLCLRIPTLIVYNYYYLKLVKLCAMK